MITNALPEKESVQRYSGLQKAAVLMVTLGEELSAMVLKHLEEDEVAAIGKEVARISAITAVEAEGILDEFYQMSMAQDYVLQGRHRVRAQNADQRLRPGDGHAHP